MKCDTMIQCDANDIVMYLTIMSLDCRPPHHALVGFFTLPLLVVPMHEINSIPLSENSRLNQVTHNQTPDNSAVDIMGAYLLKKQLYHYMNDN